MTVLAGILCSDGVVVGADSAVTFAAGPLRTIEQKSRKIYIIDEIAIIAGTGSVGLNQRFIEIAKKASKNKLFTNNPIETAKELSRRAIEDFTYTKAPKGSYGALVAFPGERKPCLCEFSIDHFQPQLLTQDLWYVSMGSGQQIVDPFFGLFREVFWGDEMPTVQDGIFAAVWAIDHAIRVNPGGINAPISVAVLANEGKGRWRARLLSEEEMAEHHENIKEAKDYFRRYRDLLLSRGKEPTSDIPEME